MSDFEMEVVYQVWNNRHGERIEVGLDGDGIGLIEIRYRDDTGKIRQSITMELECAKLVKSAIEEIIGRYGTK